MHIEADLSSLPLAGLFGGVSIAIVCASSCCLGCILYFCCTPIYYFLAGLLCSCCGCFSSSSTGAKVTPESRYLVVSAASAINYQSASEGEARSAGGGGEYEMYKASAPMLSHEYVEVYGTSGDHSHDVTLEAYTVHPLHQRGQPLHAPRFRDVWAALLFVANLCIVVTAAVHVYLQTSSSEQDVEKTLKDFGFGDASLGDVLLGGGLLLLVPVALGTLWMSVVVSSASSIITTMLWFSAFSSVVASMLSLFSGFFFGFVMFAVFAVINVWYIHSVRDRIEFASCVLGIATSAIKLNYSGILAVLCLLGIMQMLWAVLWGNAAVLGYHYMLNESSNLPWPLVAFFMFLSLYWGIQLGCALLSTTVSGVVSCWWFQPFRPQVVRGSFFRSITYSFGSVCLGSLLVSVIMALRAVLRMLRDSRGNNERRRRDENLLMLCLYGMIDALLQLLEGAMLYFNKYAYCYVAAYGDDFTTSGKNVMALFGRR
jgi:hypothetical protein